MKFPRLIKPFFQNREEVIQILETALAGKMDCRAWDGFIRIPIKGNPEMEKVRLACEALEEEERINDSGLIQHSSKARQRISKTLEQIKMGQNKSAQVNPCNPPENPKITCTTNP